MLTPQEVHDKTFPRASFGHTGYNMSSVEDFLDILTEDYSTLYKENAALKAKMKVLAEKLEEFRATEEGMRSTLLDAQRRASQMVQAAQAQSESMVTEARANAAIEIAQLDQQTQDARLQLLLARQATEEYVAQIRALCQKQLNRLETLPEAHPTVSEAEIEAESAPEAPAEASAPEAEAETEEPEIEEEVVTAKEEPEAPREDTFSEAFRRSLTDLKFGRNYNGNE